MMVRRARGVLVVAVVAAVVAGAVWASIPAERFVFGLTPIGPDEAVLLTRRNEDDATYFWAQLTRRDGSVTWDVELPDFRVSEALGFSGIAASDDRVVLLGERDHLTYALGLDRATGTQVWETEIAREPELGIIGPVLIVDGPRVYVLRETRQPVHAGAITALSLADGSVAWTFDTAAQGMSVRTSFRVASLGPDRLSLAGAFDATAHEIDGATGEVVGPLPLSWMACETTLGLVGLDDQRVVLVPRSGHEDGRRATAKVIELDGGLRPMHAGPCGTRDRDLVVGVYASRANTVGLVRADPGSGALRWQLSLEPAMLDSVESADGTLPRFLPIVASVDDEGDAPALRKLAVIADLDTGAIVSERIVDEHIVAFVTGERGWFLAPFAGTVVAIDPSTGELERLTRLDGTDGDDVRREDFRYGLLWLSGGDHGKPTELSFTTLDLHDGRFSHTHGDVTVTDLPLDAWPAPR